MKAYLLVRFDPEADAHRAMHALQQPAVRSVDLTLSPCDAIVTVEADDLVALAEVVRRVRRCPGIRETTTYPVIESSEAGPRAGD